MGILNRALLAGALAVAAVATAAPLHQAAATPTLVLRLSSGPTSVDVSDGSLLDSCAASGCITYIGTIGTFALNVATGIDAGSASLPAIHLNSVNLSGTSGGSLTISLTEYDIAATGPVAGFGVAIGGTLDQGATLTLNTFIDPGNAPFGTTTQVSTNTFAAPAFHATAGQSSLYTGMLYSMTETAIITTAAGSSHVGFSADLSVPEPASIAVLGLGLAGLGAATRWRRRRS